MLQRRRPGNVLNRPEVLWIKVATLDSVLTFRGIAALVQSRASDKVLITGEDRFLGYSLMAGTDAALVGMGAASPQCSGSAPGQPQRQRRAVPDLEPSGRRSGSAHLPRTDGRLYSPDALVPGSPGHSSG